MNSKKSTLLLVAVVLLSACAQPAMQPASAPQAIDKYQAATITDLNADTMKIAVPIFSQTLEHRMPTVFNMSARVQQGGEPSNRINVRTHTLRGEVIKSSSQTISIITQQNGRKNPLLSNAAAINAFGKTQHKDCPSSFSSISLPIPKSETRNAEAAVFSCGSVLGKNRSEGVLFIAIEGKLDLYSILWEVHGKPSQTPITIDKDLWVTRLNQLSPIELLSK